MAAAARHAGSRKARGADEKSSPLTVGSVGDLLDELNDRSADMAILYPPERLHKTQCICGIEEIEYVVTVGAIVGRADSAAKKEQDWHHQDLGDLLQPGSLDAIGSRFVFLHLLKCYAKRAAQRFLRQAELKPPQFEAPADFAIPKRRFIGRHVRSHSQKARKFGDQLPPAVLFYGRPKAASISPG